MASRTLRLYVGVGFVGANHETEIEFDDEGMTDAQMNEYAQEELENFVWEKIDANYDIE